MNGIALELKPATARRIFWWLMACFCALSMVTALDDSFTAMADRARLGHPVPLAAPIAWEFSSHLVMCLLVPVLVWWRGLFPILSTQWWRNVPAHLLATVPFSLAHTVGMVLLRKLAYWSAGYQYDFGPFVNNWLYEYRKDFMSYWMILAMVLSFRVFGLWLDMRDDRAIRSAVEPPPPPPPQDRLVVRKLNREFILNCADIDRLEADGNYVLVHTDGQSYRLRESLDGLARRLGERRFARVHRTHVVNIDRIREIQPWDHGDFRIVLKDGNFVNFSRRYRNRLDQLMR
ncbi:MAG TPA: LytTR family DNA-binding domain-containing protein [Steroidobacteraceae bacterium]|nr:LytTR family DNA-binding domain-containing protein [Steroidobacteraceae bacterium]